MLSGTTGLERNRMGVYRGVSRADLGFGNFLPSGWDVEVAHFERLKLLSTPSVVLGPSPAVGSAPTGLAASLSPHYIVAMPETEDRSLMAIVSSTGNYEVHQPTDPAAPCGPEPANTSRLVLDCEAMWTVADAIWYPQRDLLCMGVADAPEILSFDVARCAPGQSSKRRLQRRNGGGLSALVPVDFNGTVLAAQELGGVYAFDRRKPTVDEVIAPSTASARAPVITVDGPILYMASALTLTAHDIRVTQSSRGTIMGSDRSCLSSLRIRPAQDSGCFGVSNIVSATALPGGAGLAFHLDNSSVGLANMSERSWKMFPPAALPPEDAPRELGPGGLYAMLSRENAFRRMSWNVKRARAAVVPSLSGYGWNYIVPCPRPFMRIVPLNLSGPLKSFNIATPRPVSCMVADPAMRRLYVGYDCLRVGVFSVDEPVQ